MYPNRYESCCRPEDYAEMLDYLDTLDDLDREKISAAGGLVQQAEYLKVHAPRTLHYWSIAELVEFLSDHPIVDNWTDPTTTRPVKHSY